MSYIFPNHPTQGKLFPAWIQKNFSQKYHLEPLQDDPNVDPCLQKIQDTLNQQQKFISSFLSYENPMKALLLYHGLGSGKTAATINLYRNLFLSNSEWNVFIFLKASLKKNWEDEFKKWLNKEEFNDMFPHVYFISYDSPNADSIFNDLTAQVDMTRKSLYIIEEAHIFISNVYGNVTGQKGRRALDIYKKIMSNLQENMNDRIICLSGTPIVNHPFEIALLFNLLRPYSFPETESQFESEFLNNRNELNEQAKNMFIRRILGLVSYYKGVGSNVYAKRKIHNEILKMSLYHQDTYQHYHKLENKTRSGASNYRAFTRQVCNFVFPNISGNINGENRPRPGNFGFDDADAEAIMQARRSSIKDLDKKDTISKIELFRFECKKFLKETRQYFERFKTNDTNAGYTIIDDINKCMKQYGGNVNDFYLQEKKPSSLFTKLYESSPKMTSAIFKIYLSSGKVLFYSNYVHMEGLEIFKIYLEIIGIYPLKNSTNNQCYVEFHGGISFDDRNNNKTLFNSDDNINGEKIKILLLGPAGTEGLTFFNIKQIHILEPHWNESLIEQVIGRGIRQCSHKQLPMEERRVDVYRYCVTKGLKKTTDEYIFKLANDKQVLINSFLKILKQSAIDCKLFANHNMTDDKYDCFYFDDKSLLSKPIGPSFKKERIYDAKYNSGLYAPNNLIQEVEIAKIKAVRHDKETNTYSEPKEYGLDYLSGKIYDFEHEFLVGTLLKENNMYKMYNMNIYIIDEFIDIPYIDVF